MHLANPTACPSLSYFTQSPNILPYPLKSKILHSLNLSYIPLQFVKLFTHLSLLFNHNFTIQNGQQSINFRLYNISFSLLENNNTNNMVFQSLLSQVAMFGWTEVTIYILLGYLYFVHPTVAPCYSKYTSL